MGVECLNGFFDETDCVAQGFGIESELGSGSLVEFVVFTMDEPGSLLWVNDNPDKAAASLYKAPGNYWLMLNGGEVKNITSRAGVDSMWIYNTGTGTATFRITGSRR